MENKRRIILASSSPRRSEILKSIKLDFEVIPSSYEEKMTGSMDVQDEVTFLAYNKALNVSGKVNDRNSIIIGADTVVCKDGRILGKPSSRQDAFDTLKMLSGTNHFVITGLCVMDMTDNKIVKHAEKTEVFFRDLTDDQIDRYIDTREPFDKAGSYGIQGLGSVFVKKIDGCYFNVVGLPVYKLYDILRGMGVDII